MSVDRVTTQLQAPGQAIWTQDVQDDHALTKTFISGHSV